MTVFNVEFENMNSAVTGSSLCLVFAIPRGKRTAIIFAQHPDYFDGLSVVNGVERIAVSTFKSVPEISKLDIGTLDFYTTFKLAAHLFHDDHPRFHRLSRVTFDEAGLYKVPGWTLKKEWRFTSAEWHGSDDLELLEAFVQEATALGYLPSASMER